jgi:ribose-phosphate pyrophosphokinase
MPAEDGFHNPWTLAVIANAVHSQRWDGVRVFDPHSTESLGQLHALPIWANRQVKAVLGLLNVSPVIVAPDEGARERVNRLMYLDAIPPNTPVVQMQKVRNPSTGALSGFQFEAEPGAVLRNATALIIDDLCDGGGTFEGVAHLLREAGAAKVLLYVSHGVFSKGLPLKGIDHVFTTDSYKAQHKAPEGYLTIFPWGTGV